MFAGLRSSLAALAFVLAGTAARSDEPARPVAIPSNPPMTTTDFENRVRPLLVDRCVKCHGPRKQESNLRLDSRVAMMQGGDSGPAIVAGKARARACSSRRSGARGTSRCPLTRGSPTTRSRR